MSRISLRHNLIVRLTHWVNTLAFFALIVSGTAILLAHPRLYWGETGGYGSPALLELPLPLNTDQSGWGRSLHFLAAWVCVLNGIAYVGYGIVSRHFGKEQAMKYSLPQRMAYTAVVFVLFPLMIVTGLGMSPAVTAALPFIGSLFGGHQSSRTIHFFVMDMLVFFVIGHVAMVLLSGFGSRMRGMILGREIPLRESL